jgi:hypothetical protein
MAVRTPLLLLLMLSSVAIAQPAPSIRHTLANAADRLEDVLVNNREGSRECRRRIDPVLRKALDAVEDFRPSETSLASLDAVIATLDELHHTKQLGCPEGTGKQIHAAIEDLTAARDQLRQRMAPRVIISPPEVEDTPQGPVIWIPAITLWGTEGHTVYVASRWHADNSAEWTKWQSYPAIVVPPGAQFVWPEPHRQTFDPNQMRAIDTAGGRFTVHVAVFDGDKEIAGVDVPFSSRRGRQGPPPPPQGVVVAAPPPGPGPGAVVVPPPPPAYAATDCGTGFDDPGCNFTRPNKPLTRGDLDALITAMRGARWEGQRVDVLRDQLGPRFLTARQLGMVLDQFRQDPLKLEAARVAVPRLVDPQNAAALTSRFLSPDMQRDYRALLGPPPRR